MTDATASLLHWLRQDGTELPLAQLPAAIDALSRLDAELVGASRGSQPGEVLDLLGLVASTLQVELPEELGLTAYVALLQKLPPHVLKQACFEVLGEHTYRTMPAPAAFLDTPVARSWALTLPLMRRIVAQHIRALGKRL